MVKERSRQSAGRVRQVLGRVLVLLVLAAAGVVTGRLAVLVLDDPAPVTAPQARPVPAPGTPPLVSQDGAPSGRSLRRAAAVLHAWDADRALAYARGDPAALRRLYAPGSRAGIRDQRVLQAYAERGLVLRGLRTQVLSLRVVGAGRNRLEVEVTDRLVGGRAVPEVAGRAAGAGLPRDAPTTRLLVLVREAAQWRVRSVQAA